MDNAIIQGRDIELDINIRSFWKTSEDSIMDAIKESCVPKYYSIFEVDIDMPEKTTSADDEIKMDNEKDGSISIKLVDARYKIHSRNEHEEMNNAIETIAASLSDSLKDVGILFTLWSCSSVD